MESGSTSRGKKTLETNFALPTRQMLLFVSVPWKSVQPSMPAYEKRKYGIPPLGNFATLPNRKEKMPAAMSGCRTTQTMPSAVCL